LGIALQGSRFSRGERNNAVVYQLFGQHTTFGKVKKCVFLLEMIFGGDSMAKEILEQVRAAELNNDNMLEQAKVEVGEHQEAKSSELTLMKKESQERVQKALDDLRDKEEKILKEAETKLQKEISDSDANYRALYESNKKEAVGMILERVKTLYGG
jgi:vacuolar-type H+-ATPase subunit H